MLVRSGLVEPRASRRTRSDHRCWERTHLMELWQLDVMETRLRDRLGREDPDRRGPPGFCVVACPMPCATAHAVCEAFAQALRAYGVPQAVFTDNGRVFSGRHARARDGVLFDRVIYTHHRRPRHRTFA
jgi:hypothetical protein